MKNVGLISGVMLIGIALFHNLFAGPTYAAKWERGAQTVLLYGDDHSTSEKDKTREIKATAAFCTELEKAHEAPHKTLVLCEDKKFSLAAKVYSHPNSYSDIKLFFGRWNNCFMRISGHFAHLLSSQGTQKAGFGIQEKSIDPRDIFYVLEDALKYCSDLIETTEQREKAYEEIKDWNIAKIFDWGICNLKFYAHFASNDCVRKIFDEIAEIFIKRKEILWKKFLTDSGLSRKELDKMTIATIAECIKNNDDRYLKFFNWLKEHISGIGREYNCEAVEAEALWHIIEMKPTYPKIIVIAGAYHVRNLEKYLLTLGFKQGLQYAQNTIDIYDKYIASRSSFRNIIDTSHALRVYPLDPLDEFGQYLFTKELENSCDLFYKLKPENISATQKQMYENYAAAKKILNASDQYSLVPFECFEWINESEEPATKKRSREDDLLEKPKKKKKKRKKFDFYY